MRFVNKTISRISVLLLVAVGLAFSVTAHNSYKSFTTIEYNPRTSHVEVILMIHADELEAILSVRHGKRLSFINEEDIAALNLEAEKELIKSYKISADGTPLTLTYLGAEMEDRTIYAYLRADYPAEPQKYLVMNSLLLNELDEQKNEIMAVGTKGRIAATLSKGDDPVLLDMENAVK